MKYTEEQKANQQILKQVLEDKNAPEFDTDLLNSWFNPGRLPDPEKSPPCGSLSCVGGDNYLRMYPEKAALQARRIYTNRHFNQFLGNFNEHFGFSKVFCIHLSTGNVFGSAIAGTIQQRLDYVNEMIELGE